MSILRTWLIDRKWLSKIVIALLSFLVGATLGAAGGVWWTKEGFGISRELGVVYTLASESEVAFEQYLSAKPEVAMYALERFAALLQAYERTDLSTVNKRMITTDLAYTFMRIGIVAERLGESSRASQAYTQALETYRQVHSQFNTVEELKQLIQKLDDGGRRARGKKMG
jgi:tetratricopeptide (TPR) repeat protein